MLSEFYFYRIYAPTIIAHKILPNQVDQYRHNFINNSDLERKENHQCRSLIGPRYKKQYLVASIINAPTYPYGKPTVVHALKCGPSDINHPAYGCLSKWMR